MISLKMYLHTMTTSLILYVLSSKSSEASMMPAGMGMNESTTCEEFGRTARFNPYSVVGVWWFMFYYWSTPRSAELFYFHKPTSTQMKHIHEILDGQVTVPINWTARHVLMTDVDNATRLLVERSDRGEYWMYILAKDRPKKTKMAPLDMRFKQTGDNELIGIMDCETDTAFLLSKYERIPRKKDIPDAVARIGYRGRRGRSYLYQGHEWMPIPEMDDLEYWMPPKLRAKLQYRFKNQ